MNLRTGDVVPSGTNSGASGDEASKGPPVPVDYTRGDPSNLTHDQQVQRSAALLLKSSTNQPLATVKTLPSAPQREDGSAPTPPKAKAPHQHHQEADKTGSSSNGSHYPLPYTAQFRHPYSTESSQRNSKASSRGRGRPGRPKPICRPATAQGASAMRACSGGRSSDNRHSSIPVRPATAGPVRRTPAPREAASRGLSRCGCTPSPTEFVLNVNVAEASPSRRFVGNIKDGFSLTFGDTQVCLSPGKEPGEVFVTTTTDNRSDHPASPVRTCHGDLTTTTTRNDPSPVRVKQICDPDKHVMYSVGTRNS